VGSRRRRQSPDADRCHGPGHEVHGRPHRNAARDHSRAPVPRRERARSRGVQTRPPVEHDALLGLQGPGHPRAGHVRLHRPPRRHRSRVRIPVRARVPGDLGRDRARDRFRHDPSHEHALRFPVGHVPLHQGAPVVSGLLQVLGHVDRLGLRPRVLGEAAERLVGVHPDRARRPRKGYRRALFRPDDLQALRVRHAHGGDRSPAPVRVRPQPSGGSRHRGSPLLRFLVREYGRRLPLESEEGA